MPVKPPTINSKAIAILFREEMDGLEFWYCMLCEMTSEGSPFHKQDCPASDRDYTLKEL